MKIVDGIFKAEGVVANSYIVMGKDPAIIDCGMPHSAKKIMKAAEEAGLSPKDVKLILLTHAHLDHTGSAKEIKDITNAKLAIHELDAAYLTGEKKFALPKGIQGIMLRIIRPFIFTKTKPDLLLKGGEKIGEFKVVHIPGHTEGSCAYLHERTKSLFVGDSISTEKGVLALPPERYNLNTALIKRSLQKLRALDFDNLFPGHGGPIIGNAHKKVEEFLDSLA
ncbi:MAG: MBL fold metallo-hydrolase [Candidatus Micrarchaeia archaeon]